MAPEDRFCDLVMKGGITSGIVYPPAIAELAGHYRFKNIGGTSAGAIAAVVTAAAEYQRRQTGKLDGFDVLRELPGELGQTDARDQTRLLRLFQPDAPCRRLFSVLVASLNHKGTGSRIFGILRGLLQAYLGATVLAIALSALVAWLVHWLAGVFLLLVSVTTFVGYCVYRDFTRNVVANNYGLCKGLTTKGNDPALTPWLHALVQRAAGLPSDTPLTFGQLWRAKGFPTESLGTFPEAELATLRSINLQMFTTNLAHGRPYVLPHSEPTARLFYRPDELQRYLPPEVMKWFVDHSRAYAPSSDSPGSDPPIEKAKELGLLEIPPPEDFPIVLAARMSLSFPLLFATVPFYAINYDAPREQRGFMRCLFSDGGLCSNFPMHLFDGLLPIWPTFGIQLEARIPERNNMLFLPQNYRQGFADRWTRFDQQANPASRMGGFFVALFSATQNWNDNTLSRMPGVRDRIVRVRLDDGEGGINLNMPEETINAVSARGEQAAHELIKRFVGPPPGVSPVPGWDDQRWVRMDVLIHAVGQRMPGARRALQQMLPHTTSYDDLLKLATNNAPPGHGDKLTADEVVALRTLLNALQDLATSFEKLAPRYAMSPIPAAELRVRPLL